MPSEKSEIGMIVQQPIASEAPKVAVAVGKGNSSVQALKWTLERMIPAGGTVYLVHVQPPLRHIQTPLGHLPIDQANEKSVQLAKQQRLAVTDKLLLKYKKMCEKNKVEPKIYCVENDCVEREVVKQVSNLGISKLVLGSSSHNRITQMFKGPRTSALVAKHTPDFCTVLVVCNGRLRSVKDTTTSFSSDSSKTSFFSSSECDASFTKEGETFSQSGASVQSLDRSLKDCRSSLSEQSGQAASNLQIRYGSIDKKEIHDRGVKGNRASNVTGPSMKQLQKFSEGLPDSSTIDEGGMPDDIVSRSGFSGHNSIPAVCNSTCERKQMGVRNSSEPTLVSSKGGIEASEVLLPQTHLRGRYGELVQTVLLVEDSPSTTDEAKGIHIQMKEESQLLEKHLRELESTRLQTAPEIRKREELCLGCEQARQVAQVALKDKETALKAAIEEGKRCKEAVQSLAIAKREAAAFEGEANSARRQAAAERKRYEETVAKLESLKEDLAREVRLRKYAEEKAWQDGFAKQEVIALLQRTQRQYTEYSFEELEEATSKFSEDQKLGEGGYGGVYRGTIHHISVAVKVLKHANVSGQQQFQREVELLSHIRHPHMVTLLGACHERACIVYEYMANGSLEDRLTCKDGTPPLPWYIRFRICFEVVTSLMFLHKSSPEPIIHRDLKPGNILLDHNFVSKISDVGLARFIPDNLTYSVTVYRETTPAGTFAYMDPEYMRTGSFGPHSDVFALGIVILQVLTGKQAVGVAEMVEEAVDDSRLTEVLDRSAGDWPLLEALELAKLGLRCAEPKRKFRPDLETEVLIILGKLCQVAQAAATSEITLQSLSLCNGTITPSSFVCPISQVVMDDPHIAADGFTYDYRPIKDWLHGHNTSPMTNVTLSHKNLTKNHSLRSEILEWKAKRHIT